jgi:hypothetical protein
MNFADFTSNLRPSKAGVCSGGPSHVDPCFRPHANPKDYESTVVTIRVQRAQGDDPISRIREEAQPKTLDFSKLCQL